MSCIASTFALSRKCGPAKGGIRALLWGLKSGVSVRETGEAGSYGIDIESGTFHLITGRGSFQSVAQVNEDTGATYFRDEFNFIPASPTDAASLSFLDALARAGEDDLVILAEDNNGTRRIMGFGLDDAGTAVPFPVFLSAGSDATGTELSDFRGGNVTIASVHPRPAALVEHDTSTVVNPNEV